MGLQKRLSVQDYISGVRNGDRMIVAKTITLLESQLSEDLDLAEEVIDALLPYAENSIRLGISGIPGVGKSTFIETFGQEILSQNHRLAVLTIDPSSANTKGSILGDKTRMELLSRNENVFIRPSPTNTFLGGVAAKTREAILICEAAGYDYIIVETVGVGQSETLVKNMVDYFLLLTIAGTGDDLQGIKKGIMEMADGIAINKAEESTMKASRQAKNYLEQALHLMPANESMVDTEVFLCSAQEKTGITEISDHIDNSITQMKQNGFFSGNRAKQMKQWMRDHIKESLIRDFLQDSEVKNRIRLLEQQLVDKKITVNQASKTVIELYKK